MSKLFKVGDKVQRVVKVGDETMRGEIVAKGRVFDIDIKITEGAGAYIAGDIYHGHTDFWEVIEEADELPPVPASVAYMNYKRDPGNDQRLVIDKDNGDGEGLMYIGVIPKKGSTRARVEIGINIDPDSALQLAHDLRRMAMEIKRKEKQNA